MKRVFCFATIVLINCLLITACNNSAENTAGKNDTTDNTNTTVDTVTNHVDTTRTGDDPFLIDTTATSDELRVLADSFRMNSRLRHYLDPKTARPINIRVDAVTGVKRRQDGEYVGMYVDKRTGWAYNQDGEQIARTKMENGRLLFEKNNQWVTFPQKFPAANDLPSKRRSGILGYSFFKHMKRHETRSIHAYVLLKNAESEALDEIAEVTNEVLTELKQINQSTVARRKNDTTSLYTQNISLYNYLEITLIDPAADFDVRQVHDSSRQRIDTLSEGNNWEWAVTPKTDKKNATLILKVVAEKSDGSRDRFESRNIPINISLDNNFTRRVWAWLMDNPEKLLVLILIPLVAFFGKRFLDRRKEEKKA